MPYWFILHFNYQPDSKNLLMCSRKMLYAALYLCSLMAKLQQIAWFSGLVVWANAWVENSSLSAPVNWISGFLQNICSILAYELSVIVWIQLSELPEQLNTSVLSPVLLNTYMPIKFTAKLSLVKLSHNSTPDRKLTLYSLCYCFLTWLFSWQMIKQVKNQIDVLWGKNIENRMYFNLDWKVGT